MRSGNLVSYEVGRYLCVDHPFGVGGETIVSMSVSSRSMTYWDDDVTPAEMNGGACERFHPEAAPMGDGGVCFRYG